MPKFKNLVGQRFYRLTVVDVAGKTTYGNYKFLCRCDCGNELVVAGGELTKTKESTHSCGCYHHDNLVNRNFKHGLSSTNLHGIWRGMLQRCENPKHTKFSRYGGRGIKVCERWHEFNNFFHDMGMPPTHKHTLERISADGDYELSNCKWATRKEQANNTCRNRMIEFNGQTKTLTQWAEHFHLKPSIVLARIDQYNWPISRALTTKPVTRNRH